MIRLCSLPILIAIVSVAGAGVQSPQGSAPMAAQFDAASIKPLSGARPPANAIELSLMRAVAQDSKHGRFQEPNTTLHLLIELAYSVRDYQILGEPSWANAARYEVSAKTEGDVSFDEMRPMLRSLLADRFHLELRKETRELPVYELLTVKSGAKIGPPQEGSCVKLDPNGPRPPFGSKICGGVRIGIGRIEGFSVSLRKLAELLSEQLGRPVLDKTGLAGTFDFDLTFSGESATGIPYAGGAAGDAAAQPSGTQAPAIFDALREQLGLRLQSAKGPVEVLVIGHAEKPGAN